MAAEPVFVDTNVLVYAGRPFVPEHSIARAAIDRLQNEERSLWVSPQVLREYLSVVTRSQVTAPALPMSTALADVRRFAELFNVAEEGRGTLDRLLRLLDGHVVAGKQVHDAHLVATMLEAGVRSLLTFNARDFERFTALIHLEPAGAP